MQTPSTATLRQLTEAVNARVAEEFELFDMPVTPPKLSPGIVRAAWQVMAEAIAVDLETDSLRDGMARELAPHSNMRAERVGQAADLLDALAARLTDDPATADGIKADAADPYDEAERMTSGSSETINLLTTDLSKLKPTRRTSSRFGNIPLDELKAKAYVFIRSLAVDGIMPRYADYNDACRPDDLPTQTHLRKILGLSWREMAEELGLTMLTPAQRMNQSNKQAKQEQEVAAAAPEPEPEPTPQPSLPRIPDVQVVPARVVMAEPLKPKPADANYAERQASQRRKLRVDLFDFLRKIAVDGVMPTPEEYNERKPDALPNARDVMNRLAYTNWQDIAKDAGLVTKARRAAEKAVAARRQRQVA
ncbi:MAG: hypothetical protein IT328_05980 [Caldilineaceae bacterium]|nr:hypothetical protein [Caldilineaceae bacterium]